jgi:DNA-directed RNA polymerase subunit RPC12/RpoP
MVCTEKELYWGNNERVLFFFRCEKCNGMRVLYDSGEEFEPVYKCSKCGSEAQATHSRKKNKITTKYDCSHCGFTEKDVLDLDKKPKERKEIIDKDFDVDRKRFCMSKEEGEKYIDGKANLIRATDSFKEMEEREKQKELYDEVSKIKKLNIAELEKQLVPALEKESYIRLELLKPELGKIIVIEFTVQDTTSGIHEHTRRMTLKKTINSALLGTNWKLVEDSISYRLGIISGRLRGFEYEEDIVEIVKSRQKKLEKKLQGGREQN